MSQDRIRKLKKGDVLLKEGDASELLFFVQTGKLQCWIERGAKKFDMGQVKPQQTIGDQWVFSQGKSPFTYIALQETTVLEFPMTAVKTHFEACNPVLKLMLKSMNEEVKSLRQIAKSEKLESDPTPMPVGQIARSATLIHMTAKHLGKQDGILWNVDWGLLRQFLQKFFMEPSSRTKQWIHLFQKLDLLAFDLRTNDEGEEDIGTIQFKNLQLIEDFAEFYQHYYFKSPSHEMIHYDPIPARTAKAMVELGEGAPVDHKKFSAINVKDLLERYKQMTQTEFKTTHFDHLERKGLFVKRQSLDDGRLMISFDHSEFKKVVAYWDFLREIEDWNANGFVNMNKTEIAASSSTSSSCPSCVKPLAEGAKFCSECGFKIAA